MQNDEVDNSKEQLKAALDEKYTILYEKYIAKCKENEELLLENKCLKALVNSSRGFDITYKGE